MGIFDIFKKDKEYIDCNSIKDSSDLYPQNSISVVMIQTDSGKPVTGWIDLAYVNYKYKKCCPFNLQFNVEISENENETKELDFGKVEDYFINELKKGCITHPVARVATDFGFIMDIYVDNSEFASKKLNEMYEDENKLVEFGCGFNHDPKWKEYSRITKLTK
jgi:hypothetical protein